MKIKAICRQCGDTFSPKRAALGYDKCLACGDKVAQAAIQEKSTRIMPVGNKQGYGLLSADPALARAEARGMARKTENQ